MKNYKTIVVVPYLGMLVFLLLYVLAALHYPGGSYSHPNAKGFSFWDNYLCDLLDTYTITGVTNGARNWARMALLVLCSSLMYLWFHLPKLFPAKNSNMKLLKFAGIGALVITLFMTAGNHDVVVRIAGLFGVVGMLTLFVELFRAKYYKLFGCGMYCLLILLVNYYIYETEVYLAALPVIQKITFVSFIVWFLLMDFSLYKRLKVRGEDNYENNVIY